MDGGLNRKSCDRNRKSRDLKGETADQSGKSLAGSGDRKSRDLKGNLRPRWAQSPKSKSGTGGLERDKEKDAMLKKMMS